VNLPSQLSTNLKPVASKDPRRTYLVATVFSILCVWTLAFSILGFRKHFDQALQSPLYVWNTVVMACAFCFGMASSFRSLNPWHAPTPGPSSKPDGLALATLFFVFLFLGSNIAVALIVSGGAAFLMTPISWTCVFEILAMAFPLFGLSLFRKQSVVLRRSKGANVLFAITSTAAAAMALQFLCSTDDPSHLVWSHGTTFLMGASIWGVTFLKSRRIS
jgi:hypothetical protein